MVPMPSYWSKLSPIGTAGYEFNEFLLPCYPKAFAWFT